MGCCIGKLGTKTIMDSGEETIGTEIPPTSEPLEQMTVKTPASPPPLESIAVPPNDDHCRHSEDETTDYDPSTSPSQYSPEPAEQDSPPEVSVLHELVPDSDSTIATNGGAS